MHGRAEVTRRVASLEAFDRFFAPTILLGRPGADVKIVLRNGGFLRHNFSLPEQGIDVDIDPGDIRDADVRFPRSGRLAFWCAFHRDAGMLGALDASTEPEPQPGTN